MAAVPQLRKRQETVEDEVDDDDVDDGVGEDDDGNNDMRSMAALCHKWAQLPAALQSSVAVMLSAQDLIAVGRSATLYHRMISAAEIWKHAAIKLASADDLPLITRIACRLSINGRGRRLPLEIERLIAATHLHELSLDECDLGDPNPARGVSLTKLTSLAHFRLRSFYGTMSRAAMTDVAALSKQLLSLCLESIDFADGDEQSLAEFLEHSGTGLQTNADDEDDDAEEVEEEEANGNDAYNNRNENLSAEEQTLKHSARIAFLHAVSKSETLEYLALDHCSFGPYVLAALPTFPHLRCLRLFDDSLVDNNFARFVSSFPSLESFQSGMCSNRCIVNLARIRTLTELIFHPYSVTSDDGDGGVRAGAVAFKALGQMKQLRSLVFFPPEGTDEDLPPLSQLNHYLSSHFVDTPDHQCALVHRRSRRGILRGTKRLYASPLLQPRSTMVVRRIFLPANESVVTRIY